MTSTQKRHSLIVAIGVPLIVLFVSWGAGKIDRSKLDTIRFVADSARREQRYQRDSIANAGFREMMERVDSRVGEMYCGRLPVAQRAGCR